MPAEGLAVLLRSFRLPTMAAMWEEAPASRARELGLQTLAPAPVRERGAGSARTQDATIAQGIGSARGQDLGKPQREAPAAQNPAAAAHAAGRPLCRASGEPLSVWIARPGQDALFSGGGSGVDLAPPLHCALHPDLQAGAAVVGRQERVCAWKASSNAWTALPWLFWMILDTCSRIGRRWRFSSRSWRSATSGAA